MLSPTDLLNQILSNIKDEGICRISKGLNATGCYELFIKDLFLEYRQYKSILTENVKVSLIVSICQYFIDCGWTVDISSGIMYIAPNQDWIDKRKIRDCWIARYAKEANSYYGRV